MKRRIKSTPSILWVLLLVLSASCSKDEIQIVDQDTSWQMDNKYIEEDIREQLGIDRSLIWCTWDTMASLIYSWKQPTTW